MALKIGGVPLFLNVIEQLFLLLYSSGLFEHDQTINMLGSFSPRKWLTGNAGHPHNQESEPSHHATIRIKPYFNP
jgi:hypothetical protein